MTKSRQTLIFAHRGANQEAAENTRSAFDKALQYEIDGMETDVQLSRDGVAVLWHDRWMEKLGYADRHLDDFDYKELLTLNFAQHFSKDANNESIVCLQDFLKLYRNRTRLLLEIKNRDWEEISRHQDKVKKTISMVGEIANEEIMVSSFNLDSLIFAHQIRPDFPLVYNFEDYQTLDDAKSVLLEQDFLHGLCLPIAILDDAFVNLLRATNKIIAVYTCNSNEDIHKALALGVDILISDVPQKALHMRDGLT